MEARLMLEKPAAGTRVAAAGGAAVDCRAALRDSRHAEKSGAASAYAHHGPVLYKFLLDGGAAAAVAAAEVHGGAAKGNRLHDGEKLGLRDQRDACCPGTLKRASPPRCGPPAPAALMHLDIRSPERAGELRAAPAERQPLPSSHIPVPRNRKPSGHADKEVMAATVLTSLSTSPLVLHPSSAPTAAVPEPASRAWKEVLSASYSSSTSGNWSWDASDQSVPSTPSPPLSNDNNKNFLLSPPCADDGGEDPAESTHFMFEDPIPRKRKNSMKVMFKCLWKNCEKVLSTSSGIQRHIRTLHLGRSSDSDYSDGEEDFYYSEIEVNMDSLSEGLSSLTPTSPTTAGPPPAFPPPPPPPPPPPTAEAHHAQRHSEQQHVRPPAGHAASPLSQSAPSTLCHIRTDHAYQGPVTHVRTISIGEKRQPAASTHTTVNKSHALITPAAKSAAGNRKPRGEAKKCRKVYGMEKRDMWCTACRWKKACQRFTD